MYHVISGWEKSVIAMLILIHILIDIKKIHYAWQESWNWRKVRWRGWRSKRPEICSPANFAAQTVAKQLIVRLPPLIVSSCFGGCLWKRQSCFGSDERGRAELEPVRRVFAKCLIKTFVVSCGKGGFKIKCDVLIANIRNALRVSTPLLIEAVVVVGNPAARVPSTAVLADVTVNNRGRN